MEFDAPDHQISDNSMSSNSKSDFEVDEVNIEFHTDSSDSDFNESDYDMDDDDDHVFEVNVDLGIERDKGGVNYSLGSSLGFAIEIERVEGVEVNEDLDYEHSDSLHSAHDSDDAGHKSSRRFPEFNSQIDMENPNLEKDMLFSSRESLKEAVKQYGRKNKYNLKFARNDRRRLKAICKKKLSMGVMGSKFNPKDKMSTWQIKTYVGEHTCLKDMRNRNVTSRWMASHYLHKFSNE